MLAISKPDLHKIWQRMDLNGSGSINFVEFTALLFPEQDNFVSGLESYQQAQSGKSSNKSFRRSFTRRGRSATDPAANGSTATDSKTAAAAARAKEAHLLSNLDDERESFVRRSESQHAGAVGDAQAQLQIESTLSSLVEAVKGIQEGVATLNSRMLALESNQASISAQVEGAMSKMLMATERVATRHRHRRMNTNPGSSLANGGSAPMQNGTEPKPSPRDDGDMLASLSKEAPPRQRKRANGAKSGTPIDTSISTMSA